MSNGYVFHEADNITRGNLTLGDVGLIVAALGAYAEDVRHIPSDRVAAQSLARRLLAKVGA